MKKLLLFLSLFIGLHLHAQTNAWFSFVGAHDLTIADSALLPNYPDSNLYVVNAAPPYYWWAHGLGVSFDPVSPFFSSAWDNPYASPPPFIVTENDAYTIDSFQIRGLYYRHNNNYPPDTLYMDICYANATGAFKYKYYTDVLGLESIDSFINAALPYYDRFTNSINPLYTPGVVRITKILDAATAVDTLANGISTWNFALPAPLNIPAGGKVILFTHFASSYQYPLGTPMENANYWQDLTYDLGVTPYQGLWPSDTLDFNTGIIARTQERYGLIDATYLYGTTPSLDMTYNITAPTYVHDPYGCFHVGCPTCRLNPYYSGVQNVTTSIHATAYPNPAGNDVNISYSMQNPADITVSIINILGQTLQVQHATGKASGQLHFNTAGIPPGNYFYTIHSGTANTTNGLIIEH